MKSIQELTIEDERKRNPIENGITHLQRFLLKHIKSLEEDGFDINSLGIVNTTHRTYKITDELVALYKEIKNDPERAGVLDRGPYERI